jgi:enoyl-CoA hydratase/carnithine racemase
VHAEIALLSDIVLATPDTVFQDQPHMPSQVLPGDGMHVLMPYLMGRVRASYFLFTGQKLGAEEAKEMGLVNEIVDRSRLLARADELAAELLSHPDHNLRYLRLLLTHELRGKMHELLGFGSALQGLATLSTDWKDWPPPPV